MSITVKADNEILSQYTYKLFVSDKNGIKHILLSNKAITTSSSGLTYKTGTNPVTGEIHYLSLSTSSSTKVPMYYTVYSYTATEFPIVLHYISGEWVIDAGLSMTSTSASGTYYYLLKYESTDTSSSTKPSGFPDIPADLTAEDVEELINESLNTTTSASTTAKNIQSEATTAYTSYAAGETSLAELQATIDDLTAQLETLNNMTNTTLADKIAINNAITQTQLVQDAANKDAIIAELQEDLKVSSNISTQITGKINEANVVYNNFTEGSVTQSEAITQINQYITQLTQLITPETPTADINAINVAVNTISNTRDSINNYAELEQEVSDKSQASDEEELEYLEDIVAETTDNIDSLKSKVDSSLNDSQANEVKDNVITPIFENTLIVKLLPIAALFMVLAVTLGFKYRL